MPRRLRLPGPDFLILSAFALLLVIYGAAHVDASCLDTADSAYIASANGIWQGHFPYSGFLAAHPPLLFFLGAPLAGIGGLNAIRVFSLLLTAALGFTVWRLALRLSADRWLALLAGVLAMVAPLGVYFSKLFLNDALTALLAAGMLLALVRGGQGRQVKGQPWIVAAGLLALAGLATKLTFAPMMVVAAAFLALYRPRRDLYLFLAVAAGGTAVLWLALEAVTGGAFLADIFGAQAAKAYSFTNFYEGLYRIWQFDWPLLVPALAGIVWVILRGSGSSRPIRFLLLGWLVAGVSVLATLPAEGHDTNLFQIAEPAVALLAAWGIVAIARDRNALLVAAVLWLAVSGLFIAVKDQDYITRTNAGQIAFVLSGIEQQPFRDYSIIAPGCVALQSGRSIAYNFFDQFLWEEKYKRGDSDAQHLYAIMNDDVSTGQFPAVAIDPQSETFSIIRDSLYTRYVPLYEPDLMGQPLQLWIPNEAG